MPRLAMICLLFTAVLACCTSRPAAPPSRSVSPQPATGRNVCSGAIAVAETGLTGGPADTVELLQRTYQNDPGFLAVVFDGTKAVVVVESAMLSVWQARLAPSGVAVAPSCVDPTVIHAVDQAMSTLVVPSGMIASGGYDALADAITVLGIDQDTLIAAIGRVSDASRQAAIQALADGTLRVDPQPMPNVLTP